MKTTELFVEQVLIGLVVIATAALMVSSDLFDSLLGADLGAFAALAAGAYLVGIVYDRLADTLLEDLERHNKLLFALGLHYQRPHDTGDPFEEDKLRNRLLYTGEASDYAHYLRSRMRLTRALTTLAPAMGVAVGLNMLAAKPAMRTAGAVVVAATYGIILLAKLRSRPRPTADAVNGNPKGRFSLPRTDALRVEAVRTWYEGSIGGYDGKPSLGLARFTLRNEAASWAALALAALAGVAALIAGPPEAALGIFAATVTLTALIGWSWWRISRTFYAFLRDFSRFDPPPT